MDFPQLVWDLILEYNGFLLDTTLHICESNTSMWCTLGVIDFYGKIAVSPKHFLKVLKYLKFSVDNDIYEAHVHGRFARKYKLCYQDVKKRIFDKNDYLYYFWRKNPSYFHFIEGPYHLSMHDGPGRAEHLAVSI